MPPDPPVPIAATFSAATAETVVTFDRPLQPGAINPANWETRAQRGPQFFFFTPFGPVVALGNEVRWIGLQGAIAPGPARVDYTPPPFDVISTKAVPAGAFLNFPVTMVP